MSLLELVFYFFLLYLLIQGVRLAFGDADLTLLWKEKFGLKAGKWQKLMTNAVGEIIYHVYEYIFQSV